MKPERWLKPENKLFPHCVGFTGPPHDFDAGPSDFLRIAPETVGVHGRLMHLNGYQHQLTQRADNFHLLEEVVDCMANAGADVVGQVGTNWVHAGGKTPGEIRDFEKRIEDTYQTALHMAGMSLVAACEELGVKRVALNSVYYWPDWRDGIARWLREAGLDLVYVGNFVDQGLYPDQEAVNACHWIFPNEIWHRSMEGVTKAAPDAEAILVNGMSDYRRPGDGLPQRPLHLAPETEATYGKPIIGSDIALYWRIFKTLGTAPVGDVPMLLSRLQG